MQPQIIPRPALAKWLFDRNMSLRDGAKFFDTTHETLRRAALPFDDPNMRPPYPGLMRRIIERTDGQLSPNDWYVARVAA